VWDRVRREVEFEFSELRKLLAEHNSLLAAVKEPEPDTAIRLALAATLSSFYTGVENVFRRIGKEIDHWLPSGESWHRDLLLSMTRPTPQRPPVISSELAEAIRQYLYFRHVFRQGYTFRLQWPKMADIAFRCEDTFGRLAGQVQAFFEAGPPGPRSAV